MHIESRDASRPTSGRRKLLYGLLLACAIVTLARACHGPVPLRLATYNIREFGVAATDMDRLEGVLDDTRANIIAVQEIQDMSRLEDVARRLSKGLRSTRQITSRCGGSLNMRVGFLYDANRLKLVTTHEFPGLSLDSEGCEGASRSAFAAVFRRGEETFVLTTFHLKAGGKPAEAAERKVQWDKLGLISQMLRDTYPGARLVLLGDANSTGFLEDAHGERTLIEGFSQTMRMRLATQELKCSEYFRPDPAGPLVPSILDHILVDAPRGACPVAEVRGYCRELVCRKHEGELPLEYVHVSDHCPVVVQLR